MSLVLRMNPNPYDDSLDREVVRKFFKRRGFDIQSNDQKAGIDLSGMKGGKLYAIEIGHTTDWPHGDQAYTEPYVEIPTRKWVHFVHAFTPIDNRIKYDVGIYCFISFDRTCAMFLNFKDLLKIDIEDFDNAVTRIKYGRPCPMIKVPLSFVKRTEKLS